MITETKIQKEGIERHKFCDICGEEIYIGLACSSAQCSYCKKDLCEKDIGNEEETGGDYRHVWCKECWSKGDKYRPTIEKLHEEIEGLYEKWQSECKQMGYS